MKYLITQEQWNFLNRNAMAVGAKPIEPLTNAVIRSIWESDAIQGTKFGYAPFARAVEAHIIGEKHDS